MSNLVITHAPSGLVHATVLGRERISPNVVRVTFGGDDLNRFEYRGFDQWFRLAIPVAQESRFDNLPSKFGMGGYLRFLTLPKDTRPVIRNYTVRQFRPEARELDVDFVVHDAPDNGGDSGVAGPWASAVEPGGEVAFIDQGCGWKPVPAESVLLAGDESGMPAIAGVLRDLPAETVGHALIELFDAADRQELQHPDGVTLHWLTRDAGADPGAELLPALRALELPDEPPYAFAVGESAVATGVRRHLVNERGVPKGNVTFCGYWKKGKAAG